MIMAAFSAQERPALCVCVFVCTCVDGNLVACTCQHATLSCRYQHSQGDGQSQTNRLREGSLRQADRVRVKTAVRMKVTVMIPACDVYVICVTDFLKCHKYTDQTLTWCYLNSSNCRIGLKLVSLAGLKMVTVDVNRILTHLYKDPKLPAVEMIKLNSFQGPSDAWDKEGDRLITSRIIKVKFLWQLVISGHSVIRVVLQNVCEAAVRN